MLFGDAEDRTELTKIQQANQIVDDLGAYYRANPPKDIDTLYAEIDQGNFTEHETRDRAVWAIMYAYGKESDEYNADDPLNTSELDFDTLLWFMEREDIVTQEAMDEMEEDAETRYRDEERNAGDESYYDEDEFADVLGHTYDPEEVEEPTIVIDVGSIAEGCKQAKGTLDELENAVNQLESSYQIDRKDYLLLDVYRQISQIRGFLNGIHNCD